MTQNPQNTPSITAIKKYNEFRSIRIEALESLRLKDNRGKTTRIHTNESMINKETLNYVDITILKFKNTDTLNEIIKIGDPTIQPENGKQQNPIVNHSFKIEELDQLTVHRILAHTSEEKFEDVQGRDNKGSTKTIYNHNKNVCHVCIKGLTASLPKSLTTNINNLRSGELIHVNFYFLNETSIR